MLKVFFGSDQIKVRQQAHFTIDELLEPGSELIRIEADNYEIGQLLSISSASSLFSSQTIYLLESPTTSDIFYKDLMDNLEALATSKHIFIMIEQDLTAADKKTLTKLADLIEEYKKVEGKKFNPFLMADALALRDKRNLWLLFQEAKQNNYSAEEIIGTFWWQLKTLRLAAKTNNAAEAGMKDYPYKKAKSALNTFKLTEVEKSTRALLKLYHEGHGGKRDIDIALEGWVLSL